VRGGIDQINDNRFCLRVTGNHADARAGGELCLKGELQELGFLVQDARDFDGDLERTGDEGDGIAGGHMAGGGGDGVAVGVGAGVAEVFVDALEDFFGDGVFEVVGFVVDFGPVEAEHFDEEEFDEAVAAKDVEGELFAAAGESDAAARFVGDESGVGEGLDHGGGGAGDDVHESGEAAHGDGVFGGGVLLLEVEVLEVVFDGFAGHGWNRK